MRRLLLLLALFFPSIVAADPSPIAIGQHLILDLTIEQTRGIRPRFLGLGKEWDQTRFWLSLKTGVAGEDATTDLGSQVGVHYEMALGGGDRETGDVRDRAPVAFRMHLAPAYRTWTFDRPFRGMLAVRVGPELSAGGAHWWSDTPRLNLLGAARLAVASGAHGRGEFEYAIVPQILGGAPDELSVTRFEHRFVLSLAAGSIGARLSLLLSDERSHLPIGPRSKTHSQTLGIGLEWRP